MATVPQDRFNFKKAKDLYNNGMLKNHLDCKQYVSKYMYPTYSGNHIVFQGGKAVMYKNEDFVRVYMGRLEKDIVQYYKKDTIPVDIICDPFKPTVGEGFVNMSPQFMHKKKPYKSFKKKTHKAVDKFLAYIKLIWCDNNEEVFTFFVHWLANVVQGVKNRSCVYACSPEATGKSTLTEMLRLHVIGEALTIEGKPKHLDRFNMGLLGKVLVTFEELPLFDDKQWRTVDSKLKTMISDEVEDYEDKCVKSFQAKNINNYIIPTNFRSIKGSNGRRYLVCDINTSKIDDTKYFGDLRKTCFNDTVGHALYCYLCEVDNSKFDSFKVPITQSKKHDISVKLPHVQRFLKFNYWMQKKEIKCKSSLLFKVYGAYCKSHDLKAHRRIQTFCADMRVMGFELRCISGYNHYKITYEELNEVATKFKWKGVLDNDEVETQTKAELGGDHYESDLFAKLADAKQLIRQQRELIACRQREAKMRRDSDLDETIDEQPVKRKRLFVSFDDN